MKLEDELTDEAVLRELGIRLARWRVDRDLSQAEFADEAGLARRTVQRLEAGEPVQLASFIRGLRVLGLLESLDQLVAEPAPRPLERLRLAGRERRRVRHRRAGVDGSEATPWTWGDGAGDET
jgi:transcriptional regulator with XRE-family HTH domain